MAKLDENKIRLLDTVIRREPTLFEDLQLLWLSETYKSTEITTHEDTHKQQYKQYKDYDKNYIEPVDNDFSWDYYNQKIEADAFGRQVGKTLRNYFPESNICDILDFIKTNKVPDLELQAILNIYSSEKVNKTSRKKFFRAMYDYLIGEEA